VSAGASNPDPRKPGDQVILSEQAGGSGKPAVPLPRL
jgi:hypothetical protein